MTTSSLHLIHFINLDKHSLFSPSPEICVTQNIPTGALRVSQEGAGGSFPLQVILTFSSSQVQLQRLKIPVSWCTPAPWCYLVRGEKTQIPLGARVSSSSHWTSDACKAVIWVMLWSLYNQWKERGAPAVRFIPSSCRSQKLVRWDTP